MAAQARIISPKRGELYLVNFDPTVGSEISKTRPAVILQNDIANRHSPVTIVAAVTSKFDKSLYPTEALVSSTEGGLKEDSVVLLNHIRTIDKRRLVKRLGHLRPETMRRIDRAIGISLGLIVP
jgi:mRNA interferase MazF